MLRDANDAADWWLGRHEQADPGTGEPVVWKGCAAARRWEIKHEPVRP
jgi:hypothetical protein